MPVKVPEWVQGCFPRYLWNITGTNKDIYLTFDDGPTPGVTPRVLDLLFEYNAQATFFCLGCEAEKYPELVSSIKAAGHTVGNHGYKHISGIFCHTSQYINNVEKGASITGSHLYRPPYGRIMPWQAKKLVHKHTIVQWTIMSCDFKPGLPAQSCYANVINNAHPGAIVVFHDTIRASGSLLVSLPKILATLKDRGYTFKALPVSTARIYQF